jgi:hypothetical protein
MLSLKTYRRAAVPLLAIQTSDPAEVVRLAVNEVNGNSYPVLVWDCIHGIRPMNSVDAEQVAETLNSGMEAAVATSNPVEMLRALEKEEAIEKPIIVIALGLTEIMEDPQSRLPARQAVWNLRDIFAASGSMLVMTAPMGWTNPFPDDIAVVVSELPPRENHIERAKYICQSAGVDEPTEKNSETIGDALLGLSAFAAEQALALSVTKEGIDTEVLWARKRQQISETPGLSVYDGKEKFEDLGGLGQSKKLFKSLMNGKRKPGAVVFIDEIEKSMGGSSGDTSGVSQSMLGYLLSYMQDQNATGTIFVGPPGAAKSAMAKAIGNEGEIPTISVLPPELKRRFTVGTMFFDLPDKKERDTIWDIYVDKYDLEAGQKRPEDDGWTGAEIKQCCDMADRLGVTLVEAGQFVVPVSISAKEQIDRLRREASDRYLSASNEGVYVYGKSSVRVPSRKINLKE